MDWADTLNNVSDNLTSIALAKYAGPVMTDPKTGKTLIEGQKASGSIAGFSPVMLIGGAALLLLVGYFILRK